MEALYRKYRPTTFADVIGQEHIERTLKNALEQNKVSHAYLFCGPRGTGKTTMARILAKALLCQQGPTATPDGTCEECQAIAQGNHPDVYELDAASRTGVENVREEIISRVNYAPTRGKWKVYIIDEVHMLSTAAFNALLKTLEEPPAHVVFILCTTDPQKVPETIHSRCQRFDFHRISNESIVSRLGAICVSEGAEFEGEALDLIAYRAEGGMRNALTSLEQLIAFGDGRVTLEGAQNLLGSLDETDLSEIVVAIGNRDAAASFNWLARYVETGADLAQFVRDLAEHTRNLYLLSMAGVEVEIPVSEATRNAMVDQLKLFGPDRLSRMLMVLGDLSRDLRTSSNPRLSFEIALTRLICPESDATFASLAERIEKLEGQVAALSKGQMPAATQSTSPVVAPQANKPAATPVQVAAPLPTVPVASASRPNSVAAPAPVARPVQTAPSSGVSAAASASPAQPVAPVAAPASAPAAAQTTPAAPAQPVPAKPAAQPQASAAAPSTASVSRGDVLTAQVDITNPAALQRLWHTVTSTLRKTNPARGVLFMNAKVSAEENGQGIIVSFSEESGFAYAAAQKKEVLDLLAETISSVAGGVVPFRLALVGQPAPSQAPVPTASPTPASTPAPVADDQVPLDAYGDIASFADRDSYAPQAPRPESAPQQRPAAPVTPSAPVAPRPAAAPQQPTATPQQPAVTPQPVAPQRPAVAPRPAVTPQPATPQSAASADDEEAQIKDMLTASFGAGIKFEDIS